MMRLLLPALASCELSKLCDCCFLLLRRARSLFFCRAPHSLYMDVPHSTHHTLFSHQGVDALELPEVPFGGLRIISLDFNGAVAATAEEEEDEL